MRGLMTAVAFAAMAPSAWAQDACSAPYSTDKLLGDMMAVEDGLRSNDDGAVSSAGASLEAGLGCLNEQLPSIMIGRTYRAIAAGKLAAGEEGAARGWFATSIEVDSTFEYGVGEVSETHPLRMVYADLKIAYVPEAITVEGRELGEGTYYLDGRKISTPTAVDGRPHLLQIDKGGSISSMVIKGIRFPAEVLVDPTAVADAGGKKDKGAKDKGAKDKGAKDKGKATSLPTTSPEDVYMVQRERPAGKTPLLVGGVATLVGSGVIFGYTYHTRSLFEQCTDSADCVYKYAELTNNLNVLGASVGALGVATLTWGVMVDDHGSPIPSVHFRF